jgi:hypothetical protein
MYRNPRRDLGDWNFRSEKENLYALLIFAAPIVESSNAKA